VWFAEHTVETTAAPEPVWRLWRDVAGPAADEVGPKLGREISGDFPPTIAALAARDEAT
jgi:hypothetical protein